MGANRMTAAQKMKNCMVVALSYLAGDRFQASKTRRGKAARSRQRRQGCGTQMILSRADAAYESRAVVLRPA